MYIERVTKVVAGARANPKRAKLKTTQRSQSAVRTSSNPAHLLTLGWLANPKRRTTAMAAKARPKSKNKARSAGGKRRNPGTKVVFISPKSNRGKVMNGGYSVRKKNRRNPTFFGSNVTPLQMGQYILGGLIGVTVNRVALPMMPAALTSSNTFATLTAFGLAALEWWAASFISKDFGAAVGFGALMNASTQALNAFVPSVGTTIGLSGRGTGDFVPAKYAVPQNPILDANGGVAGGGGSMRSAYPAAYALAA